jgi:arylsulfatase A-like enzyme
MHDDGTSQFRYRVAARSVDESFGRLVAGLREMGADDEVVVLFVSDHGEALGRRDYWVHSIFLWESLVRVPLVLRAPGLPPAVVSAPVGVVDVAPTLARYLHPAPSMNGFHGEDLVTYALPGRPPRRLPLLLSSVNERRLSRVGLVDDQFKLILRTDWGEPQLHDLSAPDPDEADVAAERPDAATERMGVLLRSPVFVNAYADAKAQAARDER